MYVIGPEISDFEREMAALALEAFNDTLKFYDSHRDSIKDILRKVFQPIASALGISPSDFDKMLDEVTHPKILGNALVPSSLLS